MKQRNYEVLPLPVQNKVFQQNFKKMVYVVIQEGEIFFVLKVLVWFEYRNKYHC
jgi:hypothetical protein